jgi:hypothetical protein
MTVKQSIKKVLNRTLKIYTVRQMPYMKTIMVNRLCRGCSIFVKTAIKHLSITP